MRETNEDERKYCRGISEMGRKNMRCCRIALFFFFSSLLLLPLPLLLPPYVTSFLLGSDIAGTKKKDSV
jgi:hypothetical protein